MNLFGVAQSKHYCSGFGKSQLMPVGSLDKYAQVELTKTNVLKEGTDEFNKYRDCLLRETERCLFLAISYYRRGFDLMSPAASGWAQVTFYYSGFFAARSILGMFGAWLSNSTSLAVEVSASSPGSQELMVVRKVQSSYKGSHQRFWDVFYATVPPLSPWLDPQLRIVLTPVSGRADWLTVSRNEVNYDSFAACQLGAEFQNGFMVNKFPSSLPGTLNTQYAVTDGLLSVATKFAKELNLVTDALKTFKPHKSRALKLRRHVFSVRRPNLGQSERWNSLQI